MVCLLGKKKNTWNQFLFTVSQISRLDKIFHILSCLPMCFNFSMNLLVNIPFSLPQKSSPVVLYTSSSRVVCRRDSNDTASSAFRQDLSNNAKMPHPGQSMWYFTSTLTSNTIHYQEDASSIFPIARFSLPDLILYARHIRARFELPNV